MFHGTGSCKFESGANTILLEYSNITPYWCIPIINTTVSIYDHYTTYDYVGHHSSFIVDLQLYNYSNPSEKYNEIYPTYLYKHVVFYPHVDGDYIKDVNGQPALFFIKSIKHNYLDNRKATGDMLSILFESVSYTDISGV